MTNMHMNMEMQCKLSDCRSLETVHWRLLQHNSSPSSTGITTQYTFQLLQRFLSIQPPYCIVFSFFLSPSSSDPPPHPRPISSLPFTLSSYILVSILEFFLEFCVVASTLCVPARLSFYYSLTLLYPVSYTHLDVYKRQVLFILIIS